KLEDERVDLPGDVDVLGVARASRGDDRDVVEAVSLPSGLPDPHLDLPHPRRPSRSAITATPSAPHLRPGRVEPPPKLRNTVEATSGPTGAAMSGSGTAGSAHDEARGK